MKIIKADKLVGELSPPPSKSVLHRYIIASSLAKGVSKIENISFSEDIIATIEAMKKLGANIEQKENYLLIDGSDTFKNLNENIEIDCNESGSTLRFLFPLSIVEENKVLFKGRGKLFKRPMTPYFENFEKYKIKHSYIDENEILLEGQLKSGIYEIDGNISSQFITGLLFSLPLLDRESKIIINGKLESSNYIDISLDCLSKFGIKIINNSVENQEFIIEGNQSYRAGNYRTEADYSQAAFFLVANAIGSKIKINDLSEDSLQGDKKIIDYISEIDNWNSKDTLVLDGSETPDIIPILSLKAAVSGKKIEIVNVERLRIKESDRLKATVEELSKLNFDLIEKKDSILINSRENFKANKNEKIVSLSAHSDHRIAMMIAIAATCYDGEILLDNLDCVKKSYPNFWEVFLSLGGKIYEYLGN